MGEGVPGWRGEYLKGLIGFDHIIEGIDRKIIVDDFFLALALLVSKTQVDIDNLFNLLTTILDI